MKENETQHNNTQNLFNPETEIFIDNEGKPLNGLNIHIITGNGSYIGDIKNGKFEGHGTYFFNNGDIYKGMWKNGKMHGCGIYSSSTGETYEGQFKNDKPKPEKKIKEIKEIKKNFIIDDLLKQNNQKNNNHYKELNKSIVKSVKKEENIRDLLS